ncbi:MAG: transketolase C-terminal domain-containing protein [Bacteroidales bacterium]
MEINKLNARILSKFGESGAVFGIGVFEALEKYHNLAIFSADMSTVAGLDKFKNTHPSHFFNVGIAEQNLIGMSAGMASEERKVVAVAQACFITMRSFEQLRQYAGYMKYPLIAVGINAGFSLTFLGNTHYSIEDMGITRCIPGITILSPSDAGQALKAFHAALELNVPVYMRFTGGLNCPVIYGEEFEYKIGKGIRLKEGSDVQLIATGSMVSRSLKAAEMLGEEGISVDVVDMHTIKPLDADILKQDVKLMVSIEEHSVIGGLGTAIAEVLSCNRFHAPLLRLGIKDCFSLVGEYEYLLEQHGLTPQHIADSIKNNL